MTEDQIALVEQSFAGLTDPAGLTRRFYATLFANAPQTRPLFAGADMAAQGAKLGAAIGLLVANLRVPGKIRAVLAPLGARHAQWGVLEADYAEVGAALLSALAATQGLPALPPALREAWGAAYWLAANAMIDGARAAAPAKAA